ncbi:hypothetical protein TOPH_07037, partial [Tolypocladium ophioglossoides CBS 100239]
SQHFIPLLNSTTAGIAPFTSTLFNAITTTLSQIERSNPILSSSSEESCFPQNACDYIVANMPEAERTTNGDYESIGSYYFRPVPYPRTMYWHAGNGTVLIGAPGEVVPPQRTDVENAEGMELASGLVERGTRKLEKHKNISMYTFSVGETHRQ